MFLVQIHLYIMEVMVECMAATELMEVLAVGMECILVYYDPGYYQDTTSYLVETNVFSLKSDKLIWTGTTKSSYITDIGLTVDEIMKTLYKEMIKDGSVTKK